MSPILCRNCGQPIEESDGPLALRSWFHPDLVELDCNGQACEGDLLPEAENDYAEPTS